jgi:hypothetical protein
VSTIATYGGHIGGPSAQLPHTRGRPPARLLPGHRSKSLASVTKVGVFCRSEPSSPIRKSSVRGRLIGKGKNKDQENVPSLRAQHDQLYIDGLGIPATPSTILFDDDDDDEVLDLARILVPPKRQNSIASLRKHLITPQRPRTRIRHQAWPDGEGYSEDEQDFRRLVSGAGSGGASRSSERRRLGLPTPWSSGT